MSELTRRRLLGAAAGATAGGAFGAGYLLALRRNSLLCVRVTFHFGAVSRRRLGAVGVFGLMARELTATSQLWFDCFNRGDIDGLLALTLPDVEVRPGAAGRSYRGHSGLRQWVCDLGDKFSLFVVDIAAVRVLVGNRVLSIGEFHYLRGPFSAIHTIDPASGEVALARHYFTDKDMLMVLGLLPPNGSMPRLPNGPPTSGTRELTF